MLNQLSPKIVVILPAFNESITIGPTIESFWQAIPNAEIIVVNNNSTDDTEKNANVKISDLGVKGKVINEPRQGKGNAVRRAFSDIDADIYVMADADMTYPADMVEMLIQPVIDGEADMVVGDRLSGGGYARENKRRFHGFGNHLVKGLINRLFGSRLKDIMSGYRVFSRKFVKNYPILVEGFQLETDVTLHALDKRFRILEVPVPYKDRPEGSFSKLNTFKDGARVIFTIAQILRYYRPMAFFGALGLVFALSGIVTSVPVLSDWVAHRYIFHVPLAVLSAALEIVAVMFLGVGLMLDSVTHQHRMNAERRLLGD
ncbi:MAG: glycosyltransferase family 2 protein [Desulfobulbaceae bacterium]|nr:glycosyltransferase family 2 protein [Desulfobulbaceae bacterium]